MNLNESSLRHPRTQWAIEAAMWRAIEASKIGGVVGRADVDSAAGKRLLSVTHCRGFVSAFTFRMSGHDVTDQMLAFLRSNR